MTSRRTQLDLNNFAVDGVPSLDSLLASLPPSSPSSRRKWGYTPTVPGYAVYRASLLPGKALLVYLLLHMRCKLDRKRTVSLTTVFAGRYGVSPNNKSRALAALEGDGLVRVMRRNGRNPTVTL